MMTNQILARKFKYLKNVIFGAKIQIFENVSFEFLRQKIVGLDFYVSILPKASKCHSRINFAKIKCKRVLSFKKYPNV